jgi:hypothetical protein
MKRYRVLLPVEIGGTIYNFGDVVDLDLETAVQYAHALIAVETEEENNGRNS